EGAGPSALRGQAGDQRGAGDVDNGPAGANSRGEGEHEGELKDRGEYRETQEEEGSEEQGPSDSPVQLHRPTAPRGDPIRHARVYRDGRDLARDVDPEDCRAREA